MSLSLCLTRSISSSSSRPVSLGTKIPSKVIEERRKKYLASKPLPKQIPIGKPTKPLEEYSLESKRPAPAPKSTKSSTSLSGDKSDFKLKLKGNVEKNSPLTPDEFIKSFAEETGIKLPAKKPHAPPTRTDGIGMRNDRISTTSTRQKPRFTSPVETPPYEYVKQDFYLGKQGSFTYDVDVMPFDWHKLDKNPVREPKREPWEAKEEVPPPGVIIPRWWPKTQEGWDQLDSPQVHAAEEAYMRFNPRQLTESQEYHKEKKAVLRELKSHKRQVQRMAEMYQEHLKAASAGERPKRPPTAESGGVPDPSQEYLAGLEKPSQKLREAQPLLVVVDLNGTMLHRPNPKRQPRTFVRRPFSSVFFNYCVKTFWVVVWSSARPDNVAVMCDNLSTPEVMRNNVVAVWARDKFGLSRDDYDGRVQCYKRLTKLWEDPHIAKSHPHYADGGRWSQANTVLIDDTAEKARAEPYNAIIVPEFSNDNSKYDGILPSVHDYVNELCFQSNVSNYMRENPFFPRTDFEAIPEPPTSTEFYEEKRAKKEKRKERLSYTYPMSSLTLKSTVSKAKQDSLAKERSRHVW